eukprot:SAG25_NODE_9444_length_372_cov_0.816850_2_plen_44_part_01
MCASVALSDTIDASIKLQTRDKYDNVRCFQQANDSLTISVINYG